VLVLNGPDGAVVAASIVAWTVTPRVSFATIEDMAVDPAARSSGLGARMMTAIEAEARRRGMRWLFLESGKDNHRAHGFFERHGFHTVSHVFTRKL
jgi:ribosomal protein S18 acetylase RimI-like enzyme